MTLTKIQRQKLSNILTKNPNFHSFEGRKKILNDTGFGNLTSIIILEHSNLEIIAFNWIEILEFREEIYDFFLSLLNDYSKNNQIEIKSILEININNKELVYVMEDYVINNIVKIFISYSSADRYLREIIQDRLDIYLRSAQNNYETVWTDKEIPMGGDWNEVIQDALTNSNMGILLVSPMFLGSKYSMGEELKIMLERRKTEGYLIIPVLLRECNFYNNKDLSSMQFFKTHQSEYDVNDLLRKDKLMPFDELADISNPSERLLNKYFQKFANEIDRAVLIRNKKNTYNIQ